MTSLSKILITGINGMLGHKIFQYLNSFGFFHISGVGRRNLTNPNFTYLQGDLTNPDFLEKIKREDFHTIIHCAANVNIDDCAINSTYTQALHITALEKLASAARTHIYISTDSVFDGLNAPYQENDNTHPINTYAASKLAGEKMIQTTCKNYFILRTNMYGFHPYTGSSLFEWGIKNLQQGNQIPGFSNLFFNPLYTKQIAVCIYQILIKDIPPGIYNLAADQSISKYDFLIKTAKLFNFDTELIQAKNIGPSFFKIPRPLNTTLLNYKIKKVLPEINLSLEHGFCILKQEYESGLNVV